jgi:hypothetical protein
VLRAGVVQEDRAEWRATFNMADRLPNGQASVIVVSQDCARPIIVERSMYFYGRQSGTNTIGGFTD